MEFASVVYELSLTLFVMDGRRDGWMDRRIYSVILICLPKFLLGHNKKKGSSVTSDIQAGQSCLIFKYPKVNENSIRRSSSGFFKPTFLFWGQLLKERICSSLFSISYSE